jgi:hypothetical protein
MTIQLNLGDTFCLHSVPGAVIAGLVRAAGIDD